jgi:hypothetical protein
MLFLWMMESSKKKMSHMNRSTPCDAKPSGIFSSDMRDGKHTEHR